jgi:rubrerythrin
MSVERFDSRRSSSGQSPGHRFRCVACSYGATRRVAPERCPMCGGSAWEFEDWRPFSNLSSDLAPTQSTSVE